MPFLLRFAWLLILVFTLTAQDPQQLPPPRPSETRLPSGRLQRDEILKADHEKNLEDAALLMKLSQELKADLEKDTEHVLSLATIKKTEEMEKILKRLRARLKR